MTTNKIQIVGEIDGRSVGVKLEFANMDKAGVLTAIRSMVQGQGDLCLVDIHGRVFSINYDRVQCLQLDVVETFNVEK